MEHASEIIEEIGKNKLKYKEVPVTIIYYEKGQSIFNSVNIFIKMLIKMIKSI